MTTLGRSIRHLVIVPLEGATNTQVAADSDRSNSTVLCVDAGSTTEEYNRGLSERRAKTVRDYLINRGVDANQLSWRGYGETDPIADNETAEGRELNRRVVLRILERR